MKPLLKIKFFFVAPNLILPLLLWASFLSVLLAASASRAFTLESEDSSMRGWTDHNVVFHLNPANCPANIRDVIGNAMAVWNGVGTSDLKVSLGDDSTATYAQLSSTHASPVPVILCDANFDADDGLSDSNGVAGVAHVYTPTTAGGNISYAFLLLNVDPTLSSNMTTANPTVVSIVIAHEMGHVLGLGHSPDSSALMYFDASAKTTLALSQDDVDGITYLYPRSELGSQMLGCGALATAIDLARGPRPPSTGLVLLLMFLPLGVALFYRFKEHLKKYFLGERMRRILGGFLFAMMALMFAQPAHAGLLLEPILKYENGTVKSSTNGNSETATGTGFGARIGYSMLLFWGAFDYSSVSGKVGTGDVTETQMFADFGVQVPLLRAWVGYGFTNDLQYKATGGAKYSGNAIKLGVGFTGLPIVALNLEYIMSTYTKESFGGIETSLSGVTGTAVVVSVSAPFDL